MQWYFFNDYGKRRLLVDVFPIKLRKHAKIFFLINKNLLVDDFLSENGFECNEAPSSPEGLGTFSNNIIQAFFSNIVFSRKKKENKTFTN